MKLAILRIKKLDNNGNNSIRIQKRIIESIKKINNNKIKNNRKRNQKQLITKSRIIDNKIGNNQIK